MHSQKQQFLLYRIRVHKDANAFGEIYAEHKQGLRRFLTLKLPSVQDADDALSTTFIRAWNYLQSAEVEHVGALLHTIARTVVAEFYRSRRETVSLDADPEIQDVLTDGGEGRAAIESGADLALVQKALATLPDDQATAIVLRFVEGLPVAEVAARIGKSTNATQVMLHRTLKALRKKLDTSAN